MLSSLVLSMMLLLTLMLLLLLEMLLVVGTLVVEEANVRKIAACPLLL